jgi:hypothetical protein
LLKIEKQVSNKNYVIAKVQSEKAEDENYIVFIDLKLKGVYCSDPDFFYRQRMCKHIKFVLKTLNLEPSDFSVAWGGTA